MIKLIRSLYRIFVINPRNFFFRLSVARTILRGNFFVISRITFDGTGHRYRYRMRTLGLPNDKIRRRILEDARNFYVLKSKSK